MLYSLGNIGNFLPKRNEKLRHKGQLRPIRGGGVLFFVVFYIKPGWAASMVFKGEPLPLERQPCWEKEEAQI